ncbi:MAG: molybdopterin-synthase adenylyltransferase MoeB [Flavobacteriales bacterium]|nr:molybdopterin-synthase adenylyltransferase MoeB [Flavobacteriales bacterium]
MKEALTDIEKNRYSRHILLDKIGLEGQEKLKGAKVLVIGAGGLGCPVLQYLTAAGVGTIGIIDFDIVDETNLQRQILFTVNDVGVNKAEAAENRLRQLNPYVRFNIYPERLTTKNALNLFSEYDIIVDGTDNFSTRYLVNDACVITEKPLVYGAIYKFEGQVAVFNFNGGPSYRCLFPEPPKSGSVPNCSEVGVIGVLPGLIGTQQANEVIKLILEIGEPLSGKLLTYNSLDNSSFTLNVNRSEEQIQKVLEEKDNFENMDYDFFCGITSESNLNEISIEELKGFFTASEDFQIVDVREEWEQPRVDKENVIIAPLDELEEFVGKISKDKKVVVICQHGIRSIAAIRYLKKEYNFDNLINLQGGIVNW